ncbi:MAG: 2-phospho-L-lactate guanylyltransferase [Actinomycetota bacterium]
MRILTVPVASLPRSKSRLAPVLAPLERAALTLAMLEDVLDASLQLSAWDTWVVSPDEAVLEIAARRGVRPVRDDGETLLRAIRQVDDDATERDANALAVVLGDTPLVTADALGRALATLGPVVLAPSSPPARSGGGEGPGTNLLLRRPPRAIRPRFGSDSYAKHRVEAERKGLPVASVDEPDLSFDLDVPDDILTLLETGRSGRTLAVCQELDLGSRLQVRT